ncbi:MAG: universal stress protein [Phycisphaerales bacterium]|nr:universal stress protein [Phycisphaerales bacterium]
MIAAHTERPRELKWYHAGAMLYGNLGTSRFYVLGLAFFYSLHASFWYVLGMGFLLAAVGWAYGIVCRCYPDGGGVYSAARHTSRNLAVLGALLLFAGYLVAAAISALTGMYYLGVSAANAPFVAVLVIVFAGTLNYVGPRRAGSFAMIAAVTALVLTFVLACFCIPHLPQGWHNIVSLEQVPTSAFHKWDNLVKIVLALAGIEAIANMTGIMVRPVARTARKAIWPVVLEVVVFNLVFAVAMCALAGTGTEPAADYQHRVAQYKEQNPQWSDTAIAAMLPSPEVVQRDEDIKNKVLRVIASDFVDPHLPALHIGGTRLGFSALCGLVFAVLLFSAVNTIVSGLVSIQYVMARDTELPQFFTKLNTFGVPWAALISAVFLPILILSMFQNLEILSDLYAIGVIGAIGISLGACCANKEMPVNRWERYGMAVLVMVMSAIELTLAWDRPHAFGFALSILAGGLAMRFATKTYPKLSILGKAYALTCSSATFMMIAICLVIYRHAAAVDVARILPLIDSPDVVLIVLMAIFCVLLVLVGSSVSTAISYYRKAGFLVFKRVPSLTPSPAIPELPHADQLTGTPAKELDMSRPHIMAATRGGKPLLEFAASYTANINGVLFVLYVRQLNVSFTGPVKSLSLEEDHQAREVFALAEDFAKKAGIQIIPIYAVSPDIPYTILDFAATYNVQALLMGVSRKGSLLRALQGDVITSVADNLPPDIPLLIHA